MPTKKNTPTLYKAVQPNGRDFYSGRVDYAAALDSGTTVKHPSPGVVGDSSASGYLSVTDSPMDIPGSSWPLRLFEVEPVGECWMPGGGYAHKHAVHELRVVREVPAYLVYGPEGEQVRVLIDAFYALTSTAKWEMHYARPIGFYQAYERIYRAASSLGVWSDPAGFGLGLCGDDWNAGLCGALALLVRGLDPKSISDEDYETLTAPWRAKQGPVSPKDNLPAIGFAPKKSRAKR